MRKSHGSGDRFPRAAIVLFAIVASIAFALWSPNAGAESSFYAGNSDGNCDSCHGATPTTCNGCHHHGPSNLSAQTNKTSYAPGETVTVTFTGGRSSGATNGVGGWIRAILYLNNVEVTRSPSGTGGGNSFPITFTTTAPTSAGSYTYQAAWFGNLYDSGNETNANHGEQRVYTNNFTVGAAGPATKIGVFRAALPGQWYLDGNGNGAWNSGTEAAAYFGSAGDIPVAGDWNGSGTTKIGVFRNGAWYLDMNGNDAWDAGTDAVAYFGSAGDIPVVGDWNGSGTTKIGVFRNGAWFLDTNGNGVWNAGTDTVAYFGSAGDVPVAGDWNGSGTTKIGVFRNGAWYLDMNENDAWDAGTDAVANFGSAGDDPVAGDWNGSGTTKIGVFRNGAWFLDTNGNSVWNAGTDTIAYFGATGDTPIAGAW